MLGQGTWVRCPRSGLQRGRPEKCTKAVVVLTRMAMMVAVVPTRTATMVLPEMIHRSLLS